MCWAATRRAARRDGNRCKALSICFGSAARTFWVEEGLSPNPTGVPFPKTVKHPAPADAPLPNTASGRLQKMLRLVKLLLEVSVMAALTYALYSAIVSEWARGTFFLLVWHIAGTLRTAYQHEHKRLFGG